MNDNKLSITFLEPDKCKFSFNQNGFLVLSVDGENKGRIKLIRSYPYSLTDEYICVHDIEDNEIGIIRDLKELDKEYDTLKLICRNAKNKSAQETFLFLNDAIMLTIR